MATCMHEWKQIVWLIQESMEFKKSVCEKEDFRPDLKSEIRHT